MNICYYFFNFSSSSSALKKMNREHWTIGEMRDVHQAHLYMYVKKTYKIKSCN
jgi:hypothetical protein